MPLSLQVRILVEGGETLRVADYCRFRRQTPT